MIIFMGVTGAGKSIQGQLLADKLNIPWLSTGELLRTQMADRPDPAMQSGHLLGDEQMIQLVDEALTGLPRNECVLDGFPRTRLQADWLIEQIKSGRLHLEAIIHLKVSEAVMRTRLQGRGRADDTEDAIRQRFMDYQTQTLPLVDDLRGAGLTVLEINGEDSIEDVSSRIAQILALG